MPGILDCAPRCCGTPAPVNIVGSSGLIGPNGTNTITVTTTTNLTGLLYGGGANVGVVAAGNRAAALASLLAAALPSAVDYSALTTAGAANNLAVATGAGQFTLSVYFRAAAITGNVLLFTYTPGYKFKIVRISAATVDAITTGAKAATLTTAIAGVPTTGGIVALAGAYALGAEQASSAAITALNTGTNANAITVTASGVTAFTEGGFMLNIELQNMDTADAVASLSKHIDDLITSLT